LGKDSTIPSTGEIREEGEGDVGGRRTMNCYKAEGKTKWERKGGKKGYSTPAVS